MKTSIMMKADDFKFPSSEERKEIEKDYPKIKYFDFDHMSEFGAISQDLSFNQISRISHLVEWNTTLKNRFGKLHETYVCMIGCYNRQFVKDISNSSERAANNFLFEYFAEIFYYFFFSCRDTIGQLIRVYYQLSISEENLRFYNKDFKNEMLKYPDIENAISLFHTSVKTTSNIRNSFTHNFTPTQRDYRSIYRENNGIKSLELGRGDATISPEEITKNVKASLEMLKEFMDTLSAEIK